MNDFTEENSLEQMAREAVSDAIKRTLKQNLPIVYLRDGRIYREYSDGNIELCDFADPEVFSSLVALGLDHYEQGKPKIFPRKGVKSLRVFAGPNGCLLYTSPSPRDRTRSRMPSSA